jgi:transcriptional regulator with XRE-family HTH domain
VPRTGKKAPNSIDLYVGRRVRVRRVEFGITQTKLANAVGVTFQQIQKYEKGSSRIGAGRLQQIADALQVPVVYFFENAPRSPMQPHTEGCSVSVDISTFFASPDGLMLGKAMVKIGDPELRRHILQLVEEIAASR